MDIRPEIRADERSIVAVHEAAFGQPDEAELVGRLRESKGYLPDLSLVAVEGGAVVGHIMLTLVDLVPDDPDRPVIPVLSLAPLGVRPAVQNTGVVDDEAYMARRLPGFRPTGPGVVRYEAM